MPTESTGANDWYGHVTTKTTIDRLRMNQKQHRFWHLAASHRIGRWNNGRYNCSVCRVTVRPRDVASVCLPSYWYESVYRRGRTAGYVRGSGSVCSGLLTGNWLGYRVRLPGNCDWCPVSSQLIVFACRPLAITASKRTADAGPVS